MSILTVDYRSPSAPVLFCESLRNTGFVVLHNHPISPDRIKESYHQWKLFFSNDLESKKAYLFDRIQQDGYFPFRSENAKDNKIGDLKEFFHVYPWGRIPEFLKNVTLDMYHALQDLSAELLQWIENYLPTDVSSHLSMPLKEMVQNSPKTLLRILHYPPLQNEEQQGAVRAAAHEDINLITLLPAATAPGLEVLDTENAWHKVHCDFGSIVVNVGDMLQMCTNHYYKSTTHRVINPDDETRSQSRFSMPLFLHPRKEVKLSDTMTATEYLHQRLREIGVY